MNFWAEYFWPDSQVARFLICVLVAVAAYWAYLFCRLLVQIARGLRALSKTPEAAKVLAAAEQGINPDHIFDNTIPAFGLPPDNPVTRHLRTLFLSGRTEARLDVAELNRSTSEEVLRDEHPLRILLNVFVIIGLLGTLMGIAHAVTVFQSHAEAPAKTGIDLLEGLRGAFSPSVCGVAISIIASTFYAFGRSTAARFSRRLTATTTQSLVPFLLPTHTQRMAEAAANAVNAAERVASFAQEIDNQSAEMSASVGEAAAAAKVILKAMKGMADSVAVAKAMAEETLTGLSERIGGFSNALDRWVQFQQRIDEHEKRNTDILEHVQQINERGSISLAEMKTSLSLGIAVLAETARSLEDPVSRSANKIAETAQGFAGSCEALVKGLSEVSQQNSNVLAGEFHEWRTSLDSRAREAKGALDNLKEPFTHSAQGLQEQSNLALTQMMTLMETSNRRHEELVNALREVTGPLQQIAKKEPSPSPESPDASILAAEEFTSAIGRFERALAQSAERDRYAAVKFDERIERFEKLVSKAINAAALSVNGDGRGRTRNKPKSLLSRAMDKVMRRSSAEFEER